MKLTVIGHYCVDVFHRADGTEERAHGGIYHSVAALANLAADRDTVYPVFGVGEKESDSIRESLSQYKNIDPAGIYTIPGATNTVHYYDDSPNERSLDVAPPIPYKHLKRFLNVDAVYVNMISGRDITVDTIDEIRLDIRGKKTPLHLDIHSLTLHVREDGTRTYSPMADWRRWCFMTDTVQMNAQEAQEISVEHFSDELLAKHMIPLMVQGFIITRGAAGATVYREAHKQLLKNDFSSGTGGAPFASLGAGDIFGAAFVYAYQKKKDILEAAAFAERTASQVIGTAVSERHQQLKALRETV